jgi:hypothetical protein
VVVGGKGGHSGKVTLQHILQVGTYDALHKARLQLVCKKLVRYFSNVNSQWFSLSANNMGVIIAMVAVMYK